MASDMKQYIEQTLIEVFPGAVIAVRDTTGGGDHFKVAITSERFAGLGMIAQHRLVHAALGSKVGREIHALGLTTRVPTAD